MFLGGPPSFYFLFIFMTIGSEFPCTVVNVSVLAIQIATLPEHPLSPARTFMVRLAAVEDAAEIFSLLVHRELKNRSLIIRKCMGLGNLMVTGSRPVSWRDQDHPLVGSVPGPAGHYQLVGGPRGL